MRSRTLLTATAATVLSIATESWAKVERIPDIENYYYQPKEVDPSVAKGGLQKLVDGGVLTRERQLSSAFIPLNNAEADESRNVRRMNGVQTARSHHGGGGGGGGGNTDDSLSAEEIVFLAAFQDNRFASAEPIYVTPNAPDPAATGNLWLYADVPVQEEAGIDTDPLLGFAQGTCQGIFSNQNGYCHFTYEFFDGLEVIASITVEGETQPTGPSILTIVGGTGELSGATGEVSLTPVSLDATVNPPLIVDDGSAFLGNPFGYYMEAIVYVKYHIADVFVDDYTPVDDRFGVDDAWMGEDVAPDSEMEIVVVDAPQTTTLAPIAVEPPVSSNGGGVTLELGRVTCAGMDPDLDYCDCDYDCEDSPTHRCGCDEAWTDSCCGTGNF
ncbi:MAG: hypothetical protein SGILL_002799 [Bacillariaceae sp.]